jgi:hypothetical protein
MSIVTGLGGLLVQLNNASSAGVPAGYTPQADQTFSISKTVDAKLLTIGCKSYLAAGIDTVVWGTDSLCFHTEHGSAWQASDLFQTFVPPGPTVEFAPTEQGSSANGTQLHLTDSRCLLIGKNAAGDGCVTITQYCDFFAPDNLVSPYHQSRTVLSEYVCTTKRQIGFLGNDHIFKVDRDIVIPTSGTAQAVLQAMLSTSTAYGPTSTFTRFFKVNTSTGATTEVFPTTGNIDSNTTQPYIATSADGTSLAIGVYCPLAQLGASGSYFCINTTNFSGCALNDFRSTPSGMPAGTLTSPNYVVWGTVANAVDAIVNTLKPNIG